MSVTVEELQNTLKIFASDGLSVGRHQEGHGCCAFELLSVTQGKWTDDPATLGMLDFRPLNDAFSIGAQRRTEYMLQLLVAYQGSLSWEPERHEVIFWYVMRLLPSQVLCHLPGLRSVSRYRIARTRDINWLSAILMRESHSVEARVAEVLTGVASAISNTSLSYKSRLEILIRACCYSINAMAGNTSLYETIFCIWLDAANA